MIHLNHAMEITMWIVLIVIGLNIIMQLLTALRGKADVTDLAGKVTKPVLMEVFPLILLGWLTLFDPTEILVAIWFYVAAVLVVLSNLMKLGTAIKR